MYKSFRSKWFLGVVTVCVLVGVLSSFTTLSAVEDQFEIQLTVGADTTAPSVPAGLTATAVSHTQIDLSWTASTDDIAVTAYRVYRDSVFVATSTGTSYSDTGLTPSTTYSYTVSAVDAAYNDSGESAPASDTTFPAPTPDGGGGGHSIFPVIYDVAITPGLREATIEWRTSVPARSTLFWGETSQYELGQSPESVYAMDHQMTISNLSEATLYHFNIYVVSGRGLFSDSGDITFQTLPISVGRENPRNFIAIPKTSSIELSWDNPRHPDFSQVRLVRSTSYFPSDPGDGEVIYEGDGENMVDQDVVVGTRYYYALFAKYEDGVYSSGALASARIPKPGESPEIYDPFDTLPKATGVDPKIAALTFLDFDFIQQGKKLVPINGTNVAIDGNENLTISLDYDKVPEVLKSILITLSFPDQPEKTFSFLLRVNEDKTAYGATIAPLGTSGIYGVNIGIVDYKNRGLKKIVGSLFASAEVAFEGSRGFFSIIRLIITQYFLLFVLLLALLMVLVRAVIAVFDRQARRDKGSVENK